MRSEPGLDHNSRRGCLIVAVIGVLILLLLVAIGFGWLGQTDRKISDLIVVGGE